MGLTGSLKEFGLTDLFQVLGQPLLIQPDFQRAMAVPILNFGFQYPVANFASQHAKLDPDARAFRKRPLGHRIVVRILVPQFVETGDTVRVDTEKLKAVLDATIVNVALPKLMATFGVSVDRVDWVLTAYLLIFGTPLPGFDSSRFLNPETVIMLGKMTFGFN
jgi:hypothetical protein